jgi:anaerobic ribonucleoside-triphosphate reductase activating protein
MMETTVRFHGIVSPSYVDGPGRRAALYLQGCSIRCPGCQNQALWPATGGHLTSPQALADILVKTGLPVTVTGGEPFDQQEALYHLLREIRARAPERHVIVYSGYTFEKLLARRHSTYNLSTFTLVDVLVDGPYLRERDDPAMQYRGSRNQRVIDMRDTVRMPMSELRDHGPALLDWDTPELILTAEGDLLAAAPVARQFAEAGQIEPARRCGSV